MKKIILGIVIGFSIAGVVYAADLLIDAKSISYESEYTEKDNVADAIDELLSGGSGCPDDMVCQKVKGKLYDIVKSQSKGKLAYKEDSNPFAEIAGCSTSGCLGDTESQTSGVWEYDEDTMDANSDGGILPIYYYRGVVSDNNVLFAGKCWLIIRTTSTGGIKMIFNGNLTNGKCNNVGVNAQLTSLSFAVSNNNHYYVGYTYSNTLHGYGNDSKIKNYIENTWFINNEIYNYYDELEDIPFCIDRTLYSDYSGENELTKPAYNTSYAPIIRSKYLRKPSLGCINEQDNLTVSNSKLKYKVGLISSDEVMLAGGVYGVINMNYYLNSGSRYWTLSPSENLNNYYDYLHAVESDGSLINYYQSYSDAGIRPVISLSNSATVSSGTGEGLFPYIVNF